MSKVNIHPEGKRKHKEDKEEKVGTILKTNKHKFNCIISQVLTIQQEHFEMEKYMFTFNFCPFKMIS